MCAVSAVLDWSLSRPLSRWQDPNFVKDVDGLVIKMKEYDKETGQPDCELKEKKDALRRIADLLGIKIGFLE